jgi:hypothetical protein
MALIGRLLALALLAGPALGGPVFSQTPVPGPPTGTAADGKAFRILDRIAKDVDGSVIFTGEIAGAVPVGRTPSGALSICINCTGEKAPAEPVDKIGKDVKEKGASTAAMGAVLVCDGSRLWNSRFSKGVIVFQNDRGFDADGGEYEAFPTAGDDTQTYQVGSLTIVAGRTGEMDEKRPAASAPFQIAMRYRWSTYLAPVAGNRTAPSKVVDSSEIHDAKDLTRSTFEKVPDWRGRYPTRYLFREGAAQCTLTDAIALLATSQDEFLMAIDLRKLESKQASYFWAPYHFGQSVHLDEHSITVEGQTEAGQVTYEPDTYVEYPYLVIIGKYAKLRLTGGAGEGAVLDVGYCDECP